MILPPPIDAYGVVTATGPTPVAAWREFGKTVATQRPTQVFLARRQAWGTLAEVRGKEARAADLETLKTRYPVAEIERQFRAMPAAVRDLWTAYADGVNDVLPPGEKRWTTTDSMAISLRLLRYFGNGGAGELRNMAVLEYLRTKPVADRLWDAFDDLAPLDVPDSPVTSTAWRGTNWAIPSRATTQAHYGKLPRLSLFELMPAIALAEEKESRLIAERIGAVPKTGSYAIVIGKRGSRTGRPMLLGGPQMGWTLPSVVHPIRIEAPGLRVEGMDVPGVPLILVGATPRHAWTLTSGVGDTDDMALVPRPTVREERTLRVGDATETVPYEAVGLSPVILKNDRYGAFVKRSSFAGEEWRSLVGVHSLYRARNADEVERAVDRATLSFNLFYATSEVAGWRYLGRYDRRPKTEDPRLPRIGIGRPDPVRSLPRERTDGGLWNWNNKPAPGWRNGDTPVWAGPFRVSRLREELTKQADGKPLVLDQLLAVAQGIAQRDEAWSPSGSEEIFGLGPIPRLKGWDGTMRVGEETRPYWRSFFLEIRKELFGPLLGDFVTPANFDLVLQAGLTERTFAGRTKVDYRAGRADNLIFEAALERAKATPWRGSFLPTPPGVEPVLYANRGTYLQAFEIWPDRVEGGNVVHPGATETGPHAADQAELARGWRLRPVVLRR